MDTINSVIPVDLAISTFMELAKVAEERIENNAFDRLMCIISGNKKVYIGFSYVLSECAILYEIYDSFPSLNKSTVLSYNTIADYIRNMNSITNINVNYRPSKEGLQITH